jgi:hypothetical protein
MQNPFRKKNSVVMVLTLNARLQPIHRADLEDAFEHFCAEKRLGAAVVGGGTLLDPSTGEVRECDIEIQVDRLDDEVISEICGVFEAMLAPKGTRLTIPGRAAPLAFGTTEGLALYLNGTDLPDEVYATCDSNHVLDECNRLLGDVGRVHSWWQGPSESALYLYGDSFADMRAAIAHFVETYPLCERARIVQIA